MTRPGFGTETTVIVLRDDGTVDVQYPPRPLSERVCQWTLAFLWLLVPVVAVAGLFWI